MAMDDEAYQDLLRQEQEEIALSIQYDAALKAIRAKNEEAEKELLQLEQELLAVTSERETLARFKGFSQEQCFSVKAESYKISSEKQKAKQTLRDVDQSTAYWKDVFKNGEAAAKSLDEHVSNLYGSPWVVQKTEANADVEKSNEMLAELQQELADLENSRKFKSPKNSLDTQTVEMFRNMVRSELRLNPQRVIEPLQRLDRSEPRPSNVATPPRPERSNHPRLESTSTPPRSERSGRLESTPTRKQKEVPRRVSPPPQPQHVESEQEDDTDNLGRMEFEDDNNSEQNQQSQEVEQDYEAEEEPEEEQNLFNDLSSDAIHVNITEDDVTPLSQRTLSPPQSTPPDARPKPVQNYAPRHDEHVFKVPELPRRSPPKTTDVTDDDMNFMNLDDSIDNGLGLNSQEGGNDFYNLLGDNHGSNSDTPMFSFLQEHTNNSGDGGANFFFGSSSPQSKKDESSHGFLF